MAEAEAGEFGGGSGCLRRSADLKAEILRFAQDDKRLEWD
jgi:hypothetical protein